MQKNKHPKIMHIRTIIILVILGIMIYGGWQQAQEYRNAPFKQQLLESQRETKKNNDRQLQNRRDIGFVETVKYANAFGDVTGIDYSIVGRIKGSSIRITEESNRIKSVCFSVVTYDEMVRLFAPYTTVQVYAKFDNGETKTFSATRGRKNSTDLCVDSASRFIYNVRNSNSLQVALPFLDYSEKTTKIYEFNLKTFNGIAQ